MSLCASTDLSFPSSARQICPPIRGLSSTTVILTPSFPAAAIAADIPAGPPPTIRMSVVSLFTGHDLHSFLRDYVTTPLMSDAVDRHATFETDSHTANGPACLTGDRFPKSLHARVENSRGDGRAFVDFDRVLVDGECDQCSV